MPNYLANRWFNSTSEMSSFLVDATDEDGLGPFLVRLDDTNFKLVVWRKSSTATIDNNAIFAANGPGRWVALVSSSNTNTDDMQQFIDIDSMKAYTETPSETILYCLSSTPPVLYAWDSGSTATEDGDNVVKITALTTGRMYKISPPSSDYQNIVSVANLVGLKALTSASQIKLYYLDQTPPIIYTWDAESTATDDDNLIVKLTSVATGRMYKIHPIDIPSSGSITVVSTTAPTTVLAEGTVYIWTENDTTTYPADAEGRYPNSTITYVSNGTIWLVISANIIVYSGNPITVGKLPNNIQETWLDTSVSPSVRYGATIDSSSNLSWELI